jgi:DNA-binding SARP family transcriptional activator
MPVEPVVFREKVRRPDPCGLKRERLERSLLADDGPTVVLLLAPAGSGKTTLLSQVAGRTTAWYRAGAEDGSESGLVRHLTHAMRDVVLPEAVARDVAAEPSVAALILAVERGVRAGAQLVVDDAHELVGTPAEAALERFIELRPRQLRLLLGSRRALAFNMPRLLVSGDLRVLDGDDLRFRSWEVEELFRAVHRRPLPPEAAAALTRRTGGWAAGLQLFHLATMGKPDPERVRAARELGGRSRLIHAYLTRNVLAELDPDRREFLLITSTLGRLTGTLCDRLLNRTGSAAVLEELERQQFFTTSADDGSSYRYHQVLQAHLEGLLIDELGPAASRDLHATSARLLESEGYHREAIRAFALADDWGSVARLLQHGDSMLPVAGKDWAGLPDDDPWLALARARRLLRSGSLEPAVAAYRRAESLLDDPEFRAICSGERAFATTWTRPPGTGPVPGPDGDPARRIAEALRRATQRVPAAPSGDPLADGVARLLDGVPDEARQLLGRVPPGPSWQQLYAQLALTVADLADGDWAGAVAPLEEVALSADLEDQPWLARVARGLQAAVLRSTRPDTWGADGCAALAGDCGRDGDPWGALLITLFAGAAELRAGADEAAAGWFERAGSAAAGLGARALEAWAATFGAVAAGRRGQPDAPDRVRAAETLARTSGVTGAYPLLDHVRRLHQHPVPQPGGSPAVRVRCLGGFALEVGDAPVRLPALRPRARALLLLLAIHHGRDVHRERLIDTLWPDAPAAAGTHRLQVAASNVRQSLAAAGLGDQTVRRHADAYRLELSGAWFDLAEFEDRSQRGQRAAADGDPGAAVTHWSAALELYGGELLPEVGPAEWVLAERDRLRLAAAEAALGIAGLSRAESPADAVRAAQRAVDLDPLRDSSWLLLAELQDLVGDPTAAVATRREHARVYAELAPPVSSSRSGPDGPRARA